MGKTRKEKAREKLAGREKMFSPVSFRIIFVFALSQFSGPEPGTGYLGLGLSPGCFHKSLNSRKAFARYRPNLTQTPYISRGYLLYQDVWFIKEKVGMMNLTNMRTSNSAAALYN